MNFVRLLPVVLSLLLLAAHFSRNGLGVAAIGALLLPLLLFVRRAWVARLMQAVLVLGGLEWIRSLAYYAMARHEAGQPWMRLAVILGAVAAVTAASALVFRSSALRERYRLSERTATFERSVS